MALALARNKDYKGAEIELTAARQNNVTSSLFETLAADLRLKQDDAAGALALLTAARAKYPQSRAVVYMLLDTKIRSGNYSEALQLSSGELQSYTTDARLYEYQARIYAGLGKILQQHRALAESYARYGQNVRAIEQLQLAQKAPDGDFYEHSQVDARLQELRAIESSKPKSEQDEQRLNLKVSHHHEL